MYIIGYLGRVQMKKNKKVFIFVLSLVIIILLITIIYLAYGKDKTYTLKIPSDESQPDFTDVKILTKADLEAMNPDEPVNYSYNHLNKVRSVQGVCAEFRINNCDDALKAIYALQDIITLCDIDNLRLEEEFHDKYTDRYEFVQYVYGIEVVDGGVSVRVHTDTKEAFSVASTIHYNANIEPTYRISKDKAKEIVKNNDKFTSNKITNMELVVYQYGTLAWYIEIDNFEYPGLYINANTGDIIYIVQVEAIAQN